MCIMAKDKRPVPAVPKSKEPIKYMLREDGQFTLFPSNIMKSTSSVFDVFGTYTEEPDTPILIDDTYEDANSDDIPITTRVMINYDGIPVKIDERLDAFDREIMDGVATLMQSNTMFTAKELCRIVLGKKRNHKISPVQSRNMVNRIDKLRHIDVTVNITDLSETDSPVAEKLKQKGVIKSRYRGYLFPAEYVDVEMLGDHDCLVKMLKTPPIIQYALTLRKYRVFPLKYADTSINKNERTVVMQSYLMRTIDRMYRGDTTRFIAVPDIYEAIGESNASPQLKLRFRRMAQTILSDWSQMGFIKGYSADTVRQQTVRYAIELQDKSPIKQYERGMPGL